MYLRKTRQVALSEIFVDFPSYLIMKIYNWLIRYRLPISILCFGLGIWAQVFSGFWPASPLYVTGLVLFVTHFLFGPLRLIQNAIEAGDLARAEKILHSIRYPQLLYKPIRSVYYTIKGSIAMANKDFDAAEKLMHKSLDIGLPMKQAEGANKLQLGMLAVQKRDFKKAESLLKQALQDGVPDADSKAMALLQLSSIVANKRAFRQAKIYFKKAKDLRPRNEEVRSQIKQMEKYIARLPG